MPPNSNTKLANAGPYADVSKGKLPIYSWKQVAEHNTEQSCWVYVQNKVYDITPWLSKHPGGKQVLLLSGGRDITDMLTSYHPFTDKPAKILDSYLIGEIHDTEFPQYAPDSGIYRTMRQRVGEYFVKTKQSYKDPLPGLWRLALFFAVAAVSFLVAYNQKYSWWVRILAAQLFGVCQALPLLHAMHDASHTAIGGNQTWWMSIGRLTMDWFAGASLASWHHQHIVGHHLYTNVMGADPDLPVTKTGDIRRVTPFQLPAVFYRFQHVYMFALYSLLSIKFRFQDITGLITRQNGPIRVNVDMQAEVTSQVLSKLTWVCWRILMPIFLWKIPAGEYFFLFIMAEFATSYWLAINFQVSHVSPCADWTDVSPTKFDKEWAVTQIRTSVDYAHDSFWPTFLSGALNYQTVHHLFPCVSQYHYPAIAPIIRQVCKEYGVPFNYLPDFKSAIYQHYLHLKQMGNNTHKNAH